MTTPEHTMVKFEFTLSDVDASNLISILHDEKVRTLAKASKFCKEQMTATDQANMAWYKSHAEYLEELKQKVLGGNTRVVSAV